MSATDILGKIGEKAGTELNNLRVSVASTYATKVSLGNVVNTIDFSPYATKVSLGQTDVNVATNANNISSNSQSIQSNINAISGLDSSKASKVSLGQVKSDLDSAKVSKVSLNAYKSGSNIFDLLKATRAELGELKVTGETTIVNTQTVEVSDNIIELNLAEDGGETAQSSGIQINRGLQSTSNINNYTAQDWLGGINTAPNSQDEVARTINGNTWLKFSKVDGSYIWQLLFKQDNTIELIKYVPSLPSGEQPDPQQIGTWTSSAITMNDGWSLSNFTIEPSMSGLFLSGFPTTYTNVVTDFDLVYTESSTIYDKSAFLWDDTTNKFQVKLGSSLTDLDVNILNGAVVKVPDENGIKINNVALGNYATFEAAFDTANA